MRKLKVGPLRSFKVLKTILIKKIEYVKMSQKCVLKLTRGSFMEVPVVDLDFQRVIVHKWLSKQWDIWC